MLTRIPFVPPSFAGETRELARYTAEYFGRLNSPGALAIQESGTWTPVLTFATPGDVAVGYTSQVARYSKIGRLTVVTFQIVTSSFTHATAAGNCRISGLPFVAAADYSAMGTLSWGGITKAGYTQVVAAPLFSDTLIELIASGSGVAASNVTATDMPTGGSVTLRGTVAYDATA